MTLPVTDAFSNRNAHVSEAARLLRRSSQKLAVFKAVYKGKKRRKSVQEISSVTKLEPKQVLNAGKPLARAGLFNQVGANPVVYEKIDSIAHIRDQVLAAIRRGGGQRELRTNPPRKSKPKAESKPVFSASTDAAKRRPKHDVFISHASEDKASYVKELATKLRAAGISVWYDNFTLKWGDKLRESIDSGLANSRFGVVVLSPAFFSKSWPMEELEGLFQLEKAGKARILPIWHNVSRDEVAAFSPMLAARLAVSSADPLDEIIAKLHDLLGR